MSDDGRALTPGVGAVIRRGLAHVGEPELLHGDEGARGEGEGGGGGAQAASVDDSRVRAVPQAPMRRAQIVTIALTLRSATPSPSLRHWR